MKSKIRTFLFAFTLALAIAIVLGATWSWAVGKDQNASHSVWGLEVRGEHQNIEAGFNVRALACDPGDLPTGGGWGWGAGANIDPNSVLQAYFEYDSGSDTWSYTVRFNALAATENGIFIQVICVDTGALAYIPSMHKSN